MRLGRSALFLAMMVATATAWGASGNLIVFDDADENGFDHNASVWATGMSLETGDVHSGTVAVYVVFQDFNAASWQAPSTYSTTSDYDGISFWVDYPSGETQDLAFLLYNGAGDIVGRIDLAAAYGTLPTNTWVNVRVPFNSLTVPVGTSDPDHFDNIVIRTYHGAGTTHFFVDDVALTGADIFKDGFD